MSRPFKCRRVCGHPRIDYFQPRGVPAGVLEEVRLTVDEFEALRLADWEGLYQEEASVNMGVSRQTFGNIIGSARRKLADALVNTKAVKIEGGAVQFDAQSRRCPRCGHSRKRSAGLNAPECATCSRKPGLNGRCSQG